MEQVTSRQSLHGICRQRTRGPISRPLFFHHIWEVLRLTKLQMQLSGMSHTKYCFLPWLRFCNINFICIPPALPPPSALQFPLAAVHSFRLLVFKETQWAKQSSKMTNRRKKQERQHQENVHGKGAFSVWHFLTYDSSMSLEVSLLLCSFGRLIILSFPLDPWPIRHVSRVMYGFHLVKWALNPRCKSDWLPP